MLLLVSCGTGKFRQPADALAIRTPGSWIAASTGNEGRISSGWLASLGDPEMTRTVNEALEKNRVL